MQNLRRYQQAWWTAVLLAGAVSVGPFASGARAQVTNMTEHGFCGPVAGPSSPCQDNGTITPIGNGNTLLQFGFTRSPDNNNGLTAPISFDLVALVPSNAPGAGTQTISETGTGTTVTGSHTLALQNGGAVFSSGTLDSFLGLTSVGGPANPIGGFLAGETNQNISGVTGFEVYLFDFGSVTFGSPNPTFDNSGGFNGVFIPGTELYSFIDGPGAGQRQDATALSSTIIVVPFLAPVPDGGMTLMLLGSALVGLATLRQRFRG